MVHMLVLCLIAACMPGTTATKAAGDSMVVEIRQQGSPKPGATTLKWNLVFPAQLMDMQGDTPDLGGAAAAAGKSLQCNRSKPYVLACILFGGAQPVGEGALAVIHFKIQGAAQTGKTSLRLERVEATAADSKMSFWSDAEATVTIH